MPKSVRKSVAGNKPASKSSQLNKTQQRNLVIVMLIMLVNALAYGILIPLLYPYASRFGLNPFGLGMLITGFSIAQFIATPILGRLSDKFGRKPVLLFCLFGTSLSLALFALANSIPMLFLARIVDGITGGNISVAQAVIADSTTGKDRAKAFGFLGASFGFGFLFGPAIAGILSKINLTLPFWCAAVLALAGTILGMVIMKETLPKNKRQASNKPLFDFKALFGALFLPATGIILFLTLLAATAANAFVVGIQSSMNDVYKLTTLQNGLVLSAIGVISIVMQMVGLPILLKRIPHKKWIISASFGLCAVAMTGLALMGALPFFFASLFLLAIVMAPITPVLTALISERTKAEDQGIILGINASYTSIGQIIGPLLAAVASTRSLGLTFWVAMAVMVLGAVASVGLYKKPAKLVDV
jgi:multidrug resistance protein